MFSKITNIAKKSLKDIALKVGLMSNQEAWNEVLAAVKNKDTVSPTVLAAAVKFIQDEINTRDQKLR